MYRMSTIRAALEQQLPANRLSHEPRWPDADSMFEGAWRPDWRRRAKYLMRLALTVSARRRVLGVCASNDLARTLLESHPRAFYPLMSHLLDRRFGLQERLAATLASMTGSPQLLLAKHAQLLSKRGITLVELDDGSRVELSLSDVSFHEGLWQIGLLSASGERLYSIGFGLTSARQVLVANVQGASRGLDGLEIGRQITQTAHGMRPPYLLMHAMKSLARSWQVDSLLGIDPHHHIKGRWNLRGSRLQFDYRSFWADLDGTRERGGNWSLPLATIQRALEDVPTKRRAMYRRRYALLRELDEAILRLQS